MQKKMLAAFLVGLAVGCFATGLWSHFRGIEQARYFDERTAELNRQYDRRQRELEGNNRELTNLIGDAGAITQRTADNLARAAENRGEASAIIADLYKANQNLDRLFTGGGAGGGPGGVDSGPGN